MKIEIVTAATKRLNSRLQVVKLDGLRFATPVGTASIRGWGFYIEGKGYLKFKANTDHVPYAPCGGKKALEQIIADGGLLNYNGIEFINPIKQ